VKVKPGNLLEFLLVAHIHGDVASLAVPAGLRQRRGEIGEPPLVGQDRTRSVACGYRPLDDFRRLGHIQAVLRLKLLSKGHVGQPDVI
jgi:hypothetical protein